MLPLGLSILGKCMPSMLFRVFEPLEAVDESVGILLTGGKEDLPPTCSAGGVGCFGWVEDELVRRKNGMPEGVSRLFVGGGLCAGAKGACGARPTGVMLVTDRFSILLAVALELSDPA